MAGGAMITTSGKHYEGRMTWYVSLTSLVAAMGGFIFGYDIGVSGGVTSMNEFLAKFFPKVLANRKNENNYCQYDNQTLQLFTSSLYLAGLVASFFGSYTTRRWGRCLSMILSGSCFLIGAVLNASAQNLTMLIIGRLSLGGGVGIANQTVPLYLSEMAPSTHRGALNILFQLATTIGILLANLINYWMGNKDWGWRLSLGIAAIPAVVLLLGGILLPETPNSLIERGHLDKGLEVLKKVRGTPDVEEEYEDIIAASLNAQSIANPWGNLFKRHHRPQLTVAFLIPFFQQVTGINAIMFYAPVLFKTIGFGSDASLMSSVITGAVMVACTLVAIVLVDRLGRRFLFLVGGVQMLICQVAISVILKEKLPLPLGETLPKGWANFVVALICIYVSGFAWSWGPLGWLVPSEVFPLEIRSAAQSITVSVNLFFTFAIGQIFLTLLCNLRWGIFLLFGVFVLIMTLYIAFFLPETKGVHIEEMTTIWAQHWFWKRYVHAKSDTDLIKRPDMTNGTNITNDQKK